MGVPPAVQPMIEAALSVVSNHPSHELPFAQRVQLYQTLMVEHRSQIAHHQRQQHGTSWQQSAAYTWYAQFTIMTARHVVNIWDAWMAQHGAALEGFPTNLPHTLLNYSEQLIRGRADPSVFDGLLYEQTSEEELNSDLYHFWGGLSAIVPYQIESVFGATYCAFGAVQGWGNVGELSRLQLPSTLLETTITNRNLAYLPGLPQPVREFLQFEAAYWACEAASAQHSELHAASLAHAPSVTYDVEKRRTFWQWWLRVALPQAWDETHG